MFIQYAVVLALSTVAFGTVFITEPVATTSWAAGQPQTLSWTDDNIAPDLAAFGPAKISIYVGNAQQQTLLQEISPSLDVSTAGSIEFTPDPKIGPNSNQYFVRFESISFKDPAAPTVPALAFSAKFTMSGMTGTFSPAVQAQISGASTAPIASATTTPIKVATTTSTPVTTPATTTPAPQTTSTSKASSSSTTATAGANATKPKNAATSLTHSGFVAVVAAAAAIGIALY